MLELEDALAQILALIPPPQSETVALAAAGDRFASEDVHSPLELPPFDHSAMDGFAVRSEDLRRATLETPVALRLAGRVAAGETFSGNLTAGECIRLFTGSPLPAGADAVVMQEDTRTEPDHPALVWMTEAIKPWENLRFTGEDLKTGARLVAKGDRLQPASIGLLAAAGVTEVRVGRRPVMGFLATGSELVEPGGPLMPGAIYESNRAALSGLAAREGAIPRLFPLVQDTPAETRAALELAFNACDLVVTSGGVSVGEMDFVKSAFEQIGGRLEFWKIAMKPGRPFVFGRFGEKFLFGLPGNPVSAFVTFLLLVRPAVLRWQGAVRVELEGHFARLAEPLTNPDERRHFVRVISDRGEVRSAGVQASNRLVSLAAANGLVDLPPKTSLEKNALVWVQRF
jgi:molybdopterin molybdotransferase